MAQMMFSFPSWSEEPISNNSFSKASGKQFRPQSLVLPQSLKQASAAIIPTKLLSPGLKSATAPSTPLLWDVCANHSSLPASPLPWGISSPGLSTVPVSPLSWDGDLRSDRLAFEHGELQATRSSVVTSRSTSLEESAEYCPKAVDSLFSGNHWGPCRVVLHPSSPIQPSPRGTSIFSFVDNASPDSPEEEDDGEEGAARVLDGSRCPHRKSWKRLRAKKGCAFFVCFQCGAKWRTKSGLEGDEAAPQV